MGSTGAGSEELYQNTPFGVMRVTNILVCPCSRILVEKVLVDNGEGKMVCPQCGAERKDTSVLLDREGVPQEIKDFLEKK